ncbi:hypothetical protein SAMN05216196_104123 [Lutimaribacter pacificus]|uniref:Sulfotransferase family protein n=1 Tax=Lutimaribacter pacificus TaxID=391948 RepID=A0A1H0HWV6_9RHOB|nr:hypothetical protein [Lutimaribacter pacificus]SDO23251.1 hypothetical protein SAMN05216196_104123 [Lutimaribacter pacificus]SHK30460.1 hypothetical protein SAMN05444142_104262 [Lutimaribacter pacificus]
MRIVVHAGFHKTGTTSIQHMMRRNGRKLARHFRCCTRRDLPALCEAARAYSLKHDPAELGLFTYELAQFLETLDPGDPRPLVISSEDLSGHMPGRFGLTGYDAAPRLMATLEQVAGDCLPDPRITFFFTTRTPGPWLRSTYAQHLRAIRFTEDRDSYLSRMQPHADLDRATARIAAAVASPVKTARLEECAADPLGPFGALLDVLRAPEKLRGRLTALPPANPSFPDHVLDRFLALNRSDLSRADLTAAKKRLMQEHRAQAGD